MEKIIKELEDQKIGSSNPQAAENSEEKLLSQMAEQEEGERNQEELIDDMTHDLRTSKTRRG